MAALAEVDHHAFRPADMKRRPRGRSRFAVARRLFAAPCQALRDHRREPPSGSDLLVQCFDRLQLELVEQCIHG